MRCSSFMRLFMLLTFMIVFYKRLTNVWRQGWKNAGCCGKLDENNNEVEFTVNISKLKIPIKICFSFLLCTILCACQRNNNEEITPQPPVQDEKTPQQVLEEQVIDDTHDAFLVDTKGEAGEVLVTVELDENHAPEDFDAMLHFKVWNPDSMEAPFQTMDAASNCFHRSTIMDANFDGYMDFSYTYAMGNQPYYDHLWIWQEEQKQFVEVPEFDVISVPDLNEETKTIYGFNRSSAMGTGEHTFHQWIEGELVCVRRIQIDLDSQNDCLIVTVMDRINHELVEVYRNTFPPDSREHLDESMKWCDLDYHGES